MQDRPLQSNPTLFKKTSVKSSNTRTLPCANKDEQSKEYIDNPLVELQAFDSLAYRILLGQFAAKPRITQSEYHQILVAIYCEDKNPLIQIDFETLIAMDDFFEQKYFTLWKRILIPDSFYFANARAIIGDITLRENAVFNKIITTDTLTNALLATPSFRQYVLNEFSLILNIINEFNVINEVCGAENKSFQKIDMVLVKKNF